MFLPPLMQCRTWGQRIHSPGQITNFMIAKCLLVKFITHVWASQVVPVVKNPPADAGDISNTGLIPGLGRSSGGGHGNPLQYACLENPMDRGAWRATVHRMGKSWTRLKRLSTHASPLLLWILTHGDFFISIYCILYGLFCCVV